LPDCTAQTVTIQAPQGQPAEQAITSTLAGNRLEAADSVSRGIIFTAMDDQTHQTAKMVAK
jgi:hypothetical protein